MAPEDRHEPDQQFGAEASRDEELADAAAASGAQTRVAEDIDRKAPRAGNKAQPVADDE